jgi:hypothetical protein
MLKVDVKSANINVEVNILYEKMEEHVTKLMNSQRHDRNKLYYIEQHIRNRTYMCFDIDTKWTLILNNGD